MSLLDDWENEGGDPVIVAIEYILRATDNFQGFSRAFVAAAEEICDKFSRALEPLTALSFSLEKSDFEKDVSE